jgi:hypothetical protein
VTRLAETIPALPVRDAAAAVGFHRDRLGTLDLDCNLITFFQRVAA